MEYTDLLIQLGIITLLTVVATAYIMAGIVASDRLGLACDLGAAWTLKDEFAFLATIFFWPLVGLFVLTKKRPGNSASR